MTAERPLPRRAHPRAGARRAARCAGSQFDPRVVEAFASARATRGAAVRA